MVRFLILLAALLSGCASAGKPDYEMPEDLQEDLGTAIVRFGVEPVLKGSSSFSDVKVLSVGYEREFDANLFWKFELGYWADKRPGAENSLFGAPSLGLVIRPWIFHVQVYAGVAAISETDNYLGGHFQFYEDVYFGLYEGEASIGLSLSHISSAGLFKPNVGRNFFTLTVTYDL